jgi:hypothetical protein
MTAGHDRGRDRRGCDRGQSGPHDHARVLRWNKTWRASLVAHSTAAAIALDIKLSEATGGHVTLRFMCLNVLLWLRCCFIASS